MQWIEKVIKFFGLFFRSNAFKKKYHTKKLSQLRKILQNSKWTVVDIRNSISYSEHNLQGTINIPNTEFVRKYYKSIKKQKKILILNENFRSNLDIYQVLKKHHLNPYILYANYDDIRNNPDYDNLTNVVIY